MAESRKVLPVDELAALRERLRAEGRTVVQCHGCFDIVHPGHLRYLRFAKEQGDVLVVSVSADEFVGKGGDRPYITEQLRMENLAAIEYVDYVCLDHHAWAGPVLETLRPDVYVKGKEYEQSADPRFVRERELVEGYGGKVIFSSGEVVYSSTLILSQFRDRFRFDQEKTDFFVRRHGITRDGLARLLAGFSGARVLVVGDPILDRYVHCDALSVASESPILSVMPLREELYLGAGALIASQIATLGGHAGFLTTLGEGEEARTFGEALERAGVEVVRVHADDRPTYVKTRYLVDETKVFKVNTGRYAPVSSVAARELVGELERRLPDYDALVVTDFGYGLFGSGVADGVAELAARLGRPYYVDVSQAGRANVLKFRAPRLATPTEEELRFAFADHESGLSVLASRYYQETAAGRLVITMGKRGAVIFDPPQAPGVRLASDYLPAFAQQAVDPVGAGDVFLSLVSLADLGGAPTATGVYLGSAAAALHVGRLGNEPVALADLERFLAGRPELA